MSNTIDYCTRIKVCEECQARHEDVSTVDGQTLCDECRSEQDDAYNTFDAHVAEHAIIVGQYNQ